MHGYHVMGIHMKTTVELPDVLFREVRRLARERGTTLRAVLESALRREICTRSTPRSKFHLRDASFAGEGMQAGIDLSDWSRIRRMIYQGRGG